jgi:hypothetical protein
MNYRTRDRIVHECVDFGGGFDDTGLQLAECGVTIVVTGMVKRRRYQRRGEHVHAPVTCLDCIARKGS